MNFFVRSDTTPYQFGAINMRCPACRHNGAFSQVNHAVDVAWHNPSGQVQGRPTSDQFKAGMRVCPNRDCRALVFYVEDKAFNRTTFPPEVIDFDASNLPDQILASLEEAIKAHAAGCYRASALMVRRVLEELCEDKAAKGDNLMKRLAALGSTVIIPADLLAAADELRLLGNDAAHIEAKTYDQIGAKECAIAIELAKELLKAVYQYANLVSRLQALKKPVS
ncbi:DUF4145 domain-containing protein [Rhizobium redzepovicii]|uniref:DUF4145 domain-containing protein n=1 Tax=Rhizobium redzepovicii TaxID=2867518 RepID=UPI0028716C37|nr:DUF4145 domain-containing protein [Rhizobium redzepovicii]MDR9783845.1 DUF4145 domain-containing protein [Rhizobium redzepovicii]